MNQTFSNRYRTSGTVAQSSAAVPKSRWAALCAAAATLLSLAVATPAAAEERILWYSIGDGLTNTTNLQNAVNFAKANNFDAICVLARYRANAYYIPNRNSANYPNPEPQVSGAAGDTLQFVIDRAREQGLRVYASFVCFMVTDGSDTFPAYLPAGSVTHVYQEAVGGSDTIYNPDPGYPRPMVKADVDGEGLWLDPGRNDVRAYTRNVLKDLVQNYDIDGVIFDRIRYPGDGFPHRRKAFGYNPQALTNMGLTNPAPGSAAFNTARQTAISNFLSEAYADIMAIKPWVVVGAAPVIYGTSLNDTYNYVFQHFPTWNAAPNPGHVSGFGNVDLLLPQYYRTLTTDNANLMNLVNADIDQVGRMFHGATLASYAHPAASLAQNICDQRQKGMKGFGLFAYAGANAAGYMTTLNSTDTSPCGTGVMGTAPARTQFTLKTGWDGLPPNGVTGFAAVAGASQVDLSWTPPAVAADGDSAARYLIFRGSAPGVKEYYSNLVTLNTVTGSGYTDTPPYGTWYYRIVPVDDYNNHGLASETGPVTFQIGEVLLSDFPSTVDGWSGTISGNTPFANGSTAVSHVNEGGNGVLNITDAGFGAGASRSYPGVNAAGGVITVVADMKIVTDPGTLGTNVAFGIKPGTGTGTSQDFAYSRSRGSAADDSGQQFEKVAASIFVASPPSDIVAAVTPNKLTWSVGSGSWTMRLDNVKVASSGMEKSLSTFSGPSADGWSGTNATNSPFPAGSSSVGSVNESGNGVLTIGDGGFDGGAVRNYAGAAEGGGIHTVLLDVRIVTDPGTLVEARVAAAPGLTTSIANLSWSQSFSTAGDDSNQAGYRTVAVPIVTTGTSDVAVYVLPSFTGSVGSGAWAIRVDNVRIVTGQQVPVQISAFELE